MYNVSSAYLLAAKSVSQQHRIYGTIGTQNFDESNIVEGSFQINNQSTDTDDVVLGSCYVGQLNAEFTGMNIGWNNWINKTITVYFGILGAGNVWQDIPFGIYKIKEAKHTLSGVQVTAYDNMIKFDKPIKKNHFTSEGSIYNIITQICTDRNVTLGNTMSEIDNMPNGQRTLRVFGYWPGTTDYSNDIETYRDLLHWVAQTMGCFATIDRLGRLVFKRYNQSIVDELGPSDRITGATFEDYITHYTGVYFTNVDSSTEDYYGYDPEALETELDEVTDEAEGIQDDIADVDADLVELEEKYVAHEITEQEYLEQKAELESQRKALVKQQKQLEKRIAWLTQALDSADDGADMDMGANPLLMDSTFSIRENERKAVLNALATISYTPFTASVACGAHYDLGDMIQFSGGLYNSASDCFGCIMAFTYTHNGGMEIQGFGKNPALTLVKSKTDKSVKVASKNASTAISGGGGGSGGGGYIIAAKIEISIVEFTT